jgi:hypothetical protein
LAILATGCDQDAPLRLPSRYLGDHLHDQAFAQAHHGVDDGQIVRACDDGLDELPVDLELVDR